MSSTSGNTFYLFFIGSILLINHSCATSHLCDIPAAKRMLRSLGVGEDTKCLLLKKRDVTRLVASYLEHSVRDQDKLDAVVDVLDNESEEVVKKAYCCSPACDKFMNRMGSPNAALIQCN